MDKILSPVKQRVIQYIDFKLIKRQDFYLNAGISQSNFKGEALKSELGGDKIAKILSYYDDINPVWLLTGAGEMLKDATITEQLRENRDRHIKAGREKSIDYKQLTARQLRLIHNSNDKVISYLESLEGEEDGLYSLISDFELFSEVIKEISETYFEQLYDIVFDDGKYLDGDKYRIDDCKQDARKELIKLKGLETPLRNINAAILKFYKEFKLVDKKGVITNSVSPVEV